MVYSCFYLVLDIGLDTAYMFRVGCGENLTIDVILIIVRIEIK